MTEDPASTSSSKVKFGFSRKLETKIINLPVNRAIQSESITVTQSVEYITSLEDLRGSQNGAGDPTADLVIPLIKRNKWAPKATSTVITVKEEFFVSSEDATAAAEILRDVERLQKSVVDEDTSLEIPLWMLNNRSQAGGPDGEGARLNVEMHPDESTLEDYETVPVEKYGLAMLRGMGWKPDQGIGKTNKQVTKPLEVNIRPRGLGLGAVPVKEKKKEMQKDAEEKAEKKMSIGVPVQVTQGREQGRVGRVTSAGQEPERWMIQLVGEQKRLVSLPEACLMEITEKEFAKAGKYLNNDKYHDHKLIQDSKLDRIRREVHNEEESRRTEGEKRTRDQQIKTEEEVDDGQGAVIWEELDRGSGSNRRRKEESRNGDGKRSQEKPRRKRSRSRSPERRRRK